MHEVLFHYEAEWAAKSATGPKLEFARHYDGWYCWSVVEGRAWGFARLDHAAIPAQVAQIYRLAWQNGAR